MSQYYNDPDYQPSEEEILESLYGIDFGEYYMNQDVCCQTMHRIKRIPA